MKIIILFAVFALTAAGHHHGHDDDDDHTFLPCAEEIKNNLTAAFTQCAEAMTTPLPQSTTSGAVDDDHHGHHGPHDPAIMKYFDECVSAKMETITDAIPIFQECVTAFTNGEMTQAQKNKCITMILMRSCDFRPPRMTTTPEA